MSARTPLFPTFGALAMACLLQSAQAQPVEHFYKGKTVSIIIGGSPGGGFDTLARAIGRHIGSHIPGNPTMSPRTCPAPAALRRSTTCTTPPTRMAPLWGS